MILKALFPFQPGIQTFYMSSHLMSPDRYSDHDVFFNLFSVTIRPTVTYDSSFILVVLFKIYSMPSFCYIYKLKKKNKNPKTKSINFFLKINLKRAKLKLKSIFSYEMTLFHFIPNLLEFTHTSSKDNWKNVLGNNSIGF